MLTEKRKRQCSGDEANGQLVPQAKRSSSAAHPLSPELGRDAWDSESSNSGSSEASSSDPVVGSSSSSSLCAVDSLGGVSSGAPGPCSPLSSAHSSELAAPMNLVSYHQINRILREAHFQSLQCRSHTRDT